MSTSARNAIRNLAGQKMGGAAGILLLLVVTVMLTGCGGDDDAERSTQGATKADMLPAGYATTSADTSPTEVPGDVVVETPVDVAGEGSFGAAQNSASDLSQDTASGAAQGTPDREPVATATGQPAAQWPSEPASTASPTTERDLGPYWLHLGSFRETANAQRRLDEVAGVGVSAILTVATVDGVTYHRVCVPNLKDMDAAYDLGERLRRELGLKYLVWKD